MSDEPEVIFDEFERETLAYFHALLPDEHDREYLDDTAIVEMWGKHSRAMFASWLVHDGLPRDIAMGMLRGWSASRYKASDLNKEIKALRSRLAATEEQLRLANIDAITAITEDA